MWKPVAISLAMISAAVTSAAAQSSSSDYAVCIEAANQAAAASCTRILPTVRTDAARAGLLMHRARAHHNSGNNDAALADAESSLRLTPRNVLALLTRGMILIDLGQFDRGIADFDDAIRIEPKLPQHYLQRAIAYRKRGDLAQADRDATRAVELYVAAPSREALQEQITIRRLMVASGSKPVVAPTPQAAPSPAPVVAATPAPVAAPVIAPSAPAPTVAQVRDGPRVALVVGNGKYRTVPELANPANDARDVSAALRALGFRVIEGYDLDSAGMRARIGEFGAAMAGASTTLFFYAGHGVQVADKNYLIPVDARLERPSALNTEAIAVDTILSDMETEKRINLVFLDACRDNPLSRSLANAFGGGARSAAVGQGLAQLNAGIGTLITFATSPNRTALDGTGRNSPFTAALLKHIHTPNLEVRTLLTRVRADVIRETNERQVPWDHSSLTGEFYFRRGG